MLRREKNITVQEQNQKFFIMDKMAGTYLFKLHVRCITLWPIAQKRKVGSDGTNLETIIISVREKINKVDAMDGNTASIGGQGLNVRSQHRNEQSAG